MKSNRKEAIKKIKSLVFTPKDEVESFRKKMDSNFSTIFLPNKVERKERNYNGVQCDLLIPEIYASHRVLIYIHGGSFVGGSRESWRGFCSSLANAFSCKVVLPEFRLPPSFPYPAALEDVQTVFRMVKTEEDVSIQMNSSDKSEKPEIMIAADGSGSSIAMALMFSLSEKFRESINKIIFFSPWLDMTSDSLSSTEKKQKDEVFSANDILHAVELYTYSSNVKNPAISALKAGPEMFNSFPEFYIQLGEKELLLSQSEDFVDLLEHAKIKCTLDVVPKMMYMFQMVDEYIPEAHLAIERIAKYINSREEV
jgi:acetyl esterase/lipase